MLERFGEAKLQLGGQLYYKVLGENGYEKSNEIPDKDIPKIYYAMLEAHEAIKAQVKKTDPKKKAAEKEKDPEKKKPAAFSDDEEKGPEAEPETTEKIEPEMPLQQDIMELVKLEAILVDKHDFTAEQIIGKLEKMFGEQDGTKLTKEQNKEAIEYFKGEIEKLST